MLKYYKAIKYLHSDRDSSEYRWQLAEYDVVKETRLSLYLKRPEWNEPIREYKNDIPSIGYRTNKEDAINFEIHKTLLSLNRMNEALSRCYNDIRELEMLKAECDTTE